MGKSLEKKSPLNPDRLKEIYHEFPQQFWIVVAVSFIDRVGGTLLFPFFALYITQKFNVGMTTAGIVLGLFSVFGLLGGFIGGALTDRFGRRNIILFGLVFSAVSTLAFGSVNTLEGLYPLAVLIGTLSNISGPAHSAMIADILPESKRQEGFGILRVVGNLAWLIGPTIGGYFASRSFFTLFVTDAIISSVVAVLFFIFLKESQSKQVHEHEATESFFKTILGYTDVLKDKAFSAFILASIIMGFVYLQMYNSLSVYLRDVHQIGPQGYGLLMSTSAITVILFQFSTSRLIKGKPPFLLLVFGSLFYALGFALFGFVSLLWMFAINIIIITIGEMINMPTMQVLTTEFAPEVLRGRYMAVFDLTWAIPAAIGPGLAGVILDNYDPNLLWYAGGILCVISAMAFMVLHIKLGKLERFLPNKNMPEG